MPSVCVCVCVYVHCVTAGLWMFVVVGQLCPHLCIFTVVRVSKLKTHKKKTVVIFPWYTE